MLGEHFFDDGLEFGAVKVFDGVDREQCWCFVGSYIVMQSHFAHVGNADTVVLFGEFAYSQYAVSYFVDECGLVVDDITVLGSIHYETLSVMQCFPY